MVFLTKANDTKRLETLLHLMAVEKGHFGCPEVTIGRYGKERVDFLMYDLKGEWRCYEIKVSVSDFRSKSHVTFVGDFNYYVFPNYDLYEKVKDEIPEKVGVMVENEIVKRGKRMPVTEDQEVLYYSMMRSLYRYAKPMLSEGEAVERERNKSSYWQSKYEAEQRKVERLEKKIIEGGSEVMSLFDLTDFYDERMENPMCIQHGVDEKNRRCKDCVHLIRQKNHGKTFIKCQQRGVSSIASTDHRVRYLACALFESKE